jgi:hypothetical protein
VSEESHQKNRWSEFRPNYKTQDDPPAETSSSKLLSRPPNITQEEYEAFLKLPLVQAALQYQERLAVLPIDGFPNATLNVKRGGEVLITVQLKQQAVFNKFYGALLSQLVQASGVSEEDALDWCRYWLQKEDPVLIQQLGDAASASAFILRYLPAVQEKVLDLLLLAAAEYMLNQRAKALGREIKSDDSLHQKILGLEKEIRRATRTLRPGPKQSWTNPELEAATRAKVGRDYQSRAGANVDDGCPKD